MILDKITAYKRQEVVRSRAEVPLAELKAMVTDAAPPRDFFAALARPQQVNLIAEIKRASPSKGLIRPNFNAPEIAGAYTEGGAAAISVLTDRRFFQGDLSYLGAVREVTPLPLLRKDFIVDPYQIYESRCVGADAILLIAAILPTVEIRRCLDLARELGLACLVEVHNQAELDAVLETDARIIGINNRDLATFNTTLDTTEALAAQVPADRVRVSESGIFTRADVERVAAAGAHAILVGEALMRNQEITPAMQSLVGVTPCARA